MPTKIAEAIRTAIRDRSTTALADRTDLCVKVMDSTGTVTGINEAGLTLLGLGDKTEICGKSWFQMWTETDRVKLEMAVAKATMGHASTLHMSHGGDWLIDILPLSGTGAEFNTILVVSRLLEAEEPAAEQIDAPPSDIVFSELRADIDALAARAAAGLNDDHTQRKLTGFARQVSALSRALLDELDANPDEGAAPTVIEGTKIG